MFLGSRRAAMPLPEGWVASTRATEEEEPAPRSSTPAPLSGLGVLLQAASRAASTPRPPYSLAYRIIRPFGAKLGDSSRLESVRIAVCFDARSITATWKRPLLRVMYPGYSFHGILQ